MSIFSKVYASGYTEVKRMSLLDAIKAQFGAGTNVSKGAVEDCEHGVAAVFYLDGAVKGRVIKALDNRSTLMAGDEINVAKAEVVELSDANGQTIYRILES